MNNMDYIILEANIPLDLCEEVYEYLKKGYRPQGGICVLHEHKDENDILGHTVFFQAMILLSHSDEVKGG